MSRSADEQAVESTLDKLYSALEKRDAQAAVALYEPENVMFTLAPPLQNVPGSSPGQRGLEQWLRSWEAGPRYEARDRRFVIEGKLAVVYGLAHLTGSKRDGEVADLWFRETTVLRRVGGDWKILHQHESVPFYMDKEKRAATDLKP